MAKRIVRSIDETGAREWQEERIAIYAGNLKRGGRIRALRTAAQVTLYEMSDVLYGMVRDSRVPWHYSSISMKERGISIMTQETLRVWERAIETAARSESARERRKLAARRRRVLKAAA